MVYFGIPIKLITIHPKTTLSLERASSNSKKYEISLTKQKSI